MVNIDFLTLKAFLAENIDFFIGARLQKIQQPTRKDFIFLLRNTGLSKKLYININPQIYHIAIMSSVNEAKRNLEIPKKPPMFCMLLRKYIEGAKISDVKVVDNERILELYFDIYDEIGDHRDLSLTIEFMGKHSNVILYDRISQIIIGCAHNVGAEKSRYRELKGGLKYIYPPKHISNDNFYDFIEQNLSNELKIQFKNLSKEEIQNYLINENYRPAIKDSRYTLFQELIPNSILQTSVNDMLDNYYSDIQANINLKNQKSKLNEIIQAKLKKTKNSISKISALTNKRDNTEKYKLYGELITANIYQKCDYAHSINVFDYINNKNITIELDNTKTLNENAQRYYKLYSKSKTTKEKSEELLNKLYMEREYYENTLYSIESANNLSELQEIKNEIGVPENKNSVNQKTLKDNIKKVIIYGFEVYIGRNNKQNDYIITKLAKDEDYWFHTKLCAGSHVLLKIAEKEPTDEMILECCKIARLNSSAAMPSKVGVIYTKAKYLRKPPSAPLGYVTYKNEKEILI